MNIPFADHAITKETADKLKEDYAAQYTAEPDLIRAHHFQSSQVKKLTDNEKIDTFTVSMGFDVEKNQEVVILEGFDTGGTSLETFLEMSQPCPPLCL